MCLLREFPVFLYNVNRRRTLRCSVIEELSQLFKLALVLAFLQSFTRFCTSGALKSYKTSIVGHKACVSVMYNSAPMFMKRELVCMSCNKQCNKHFSASSQCNYVVITFKIGKSWVNIVHAHSSYHSFKIVSPAEDGVLNFPLQFLYVWLYSDLTDTL